jgi:hypothetical protein
MIDYNAITNQLVRTARDAVGTLLSRTGPAGDIPSVIKSRQNGVKPSYPYVMIDVIDTRPTDGWQTGETVNDDGTVSYTNNYTIQYQYTVYGTDDNTSTKAMGIAQQLEAYFRFPTARQQLFDASCASLERTFPIINGPTVIAAQEYLETAFFTFTVTITDTVTTPDPCFYDTIDLDGTLNRGDDDPDPLTFNINVTST